MFKKLRETKFIFKKVFGSALIFLPIFSVAQPKLVISDHQVFTPTVNTADELVIQCTVENTGNVTAGNSHLKILLNSIKSYAYAYDTISVSVESLTPGQISSLMTIVIPIPDNMPMGTYWILYSVSFAPEIFRCIEPDRPLLVILEEIDQLIYNSYSDLPAKLLNMLDGLRSVSGGTVYCATTNNPEKLGSHFVNRPGRFDLKKKINLPNRESREYFIRHKLTPEQLKGIDIEKWISETDSLSLAHIRELICITVIMKSMEFSKAIEYLKKMKDYMSNEDNGSTIGF